MTGESLVLKAPDSGSITIANEALARVMFDGREYAATAFEQLQAAVTARAKAEAEANRGSFFTQFTGTAGLGFSMQETTSSSRGLTADVNLSRANLDEEGEAAHDETGIIFNQSYTRFVSHGGPDQGENSFSRDLSHAMRIHGKWLVFGVAAMDHAPAEGLDLLQLHAGGLCYTAWNHDGNRLELKGGIDFSTRSFVDPKFNVNQMGGIVEVDYSKTFDGGLMLKSNYRLDRAISHPEVVDGKGGFSLDAPVTGFLALRVSFNHRYMNAVPHGDKRNSFEASAGLDITLGSGNTSSTKGNRGTAKAKKK